MSTHLKRISFYSAKIPPDYSGAGRRILNQAKKLSELGYKLEILTFSKDFEKENLGRIKIKKLPFSNIYDLYRKSNGLKRRYYKYLLFLLLLFSLPKYFYKNKPDIFQLTGFSFFSYPFIVISMLQKIPFVIGTTLFSQDDFNSIVRNRFQSFLFKKISNLTKGIITISPSLYNSYKNSFVKDEKIYFIPNPINTEKFRPVNEIRKTELKTKLKVPIKKQIAVNIGIITSRKRIEKMIQIIRKLHDDGVDIVIYFLGPVNSSSDDKIYYKYLTKLIDEYSLNDAVIFKNYVDNVDEWLKISDIFLFTSANEGLPNAVLEAMSCGIPVFVTKIAGITDFLIKHGHNGFFLEEHDSFIKIKEVLNSKELKNKISINAREFILNEFKEENIIKKYISTYKSCLNN